MNENYELNLFKTANKLRGKIPPSDYKFYVLPLVFIRYISESKRNNVWELIVSKSNSSEISKILDTHLKELLPTFNKLKNPFDNIYTESNLPSRTIMELIYLINDIDIKNGTNKIDYLGFVYEYFISNFAATEGNRGGEFFTPASVVDLLVRILNPQKGVIYDPACGTGGMFVQSKKYSGKELKFYGQEQNYKTIILAYMNAILHNIELSIKNGDTLLNDCLPDLKADYIISNPPFNLKDWGADLLNSNDPRIIGKINKNNANYMWIQHFIYHLNDKGRAGFVISNGALTSSNENDSYTRNIILQKNLIDCVIQLPDKLFLGTAIPSALIFLDKNRKHKNEILFIDASSFGEYISKTQKILTEEEIERITSLYNSYKKDENIVYNKKGFSWVVPVDDVLSNDSKLMPSIYTGVEEKIINIQENENSIQKLKISLLSQIQISEKLTNEIKEEFSYAKV